jgi:Mrp family chromosome partitioning ATPase
MLSSSALADVLEELSRRYDQVVLDSPPVLPVADARILAAQCEATVLVLRAGRTGRGAMRDAAHQLGAVGAQLLGVIINDVKKREARYGLYIEAYSQTGQTAPAG